MPLPEPVPNEERLWPVEFIAVSSIAGVAIGILIGFLIMCLYRKYYHPRPTGHPLTTANVPCNAYRCYQIYPHGDRPADDPHGPVYTLPDTPCHMHRPTSNPPSYLSNDQLVHRAQTNHARTPNGSQHQLYNTDTPENAFWRNPVAWPSRSQGQLDQTQVRNPIFEGNQALSQIASVAGDNITSSSRGRREDSRHNSSQTEFDGQDEMIPLHELVVDVEPQAILRNAPPLDQNSFRERSNGPSQSFASPLQNVRSSPDDHGRPLQNVRSSPEHHGRPLLNERYSPDDRGRPLQNVRSSPDDPGRPLQNVRSSPNDQRGDCPNIPASRSSVDQGTTAVALTAATAGVAGAAATAAAVVTPAMSRNEETTCVNNLETVDFVKFTPIKQIPFGSMVLPNSRSHLLTEGDEQCEIQELKIFTKYAEDIQVIFQPTDRSKMITVRQKKIVYDCKRFDTSGGVLRLDNMGISLVVPPGAIPYGQSSLVTLVLNWDLSDNPHMGRREALISPVVYCGPHSSQFQTPCLLTFKHCAFDNRYAQIMTSETDLFEDKDWNEFGTNDDNRHAEEIQQHASLDTLAGSRVSVSVDECKVEISHFSLYTCILRSKHLHMKKWLQVAVFTHEMTSSLHHQSIRVYFLNKTPCALEWAKQNEAEYGFRLACPENVFLFEERGEDMMVRLSYLSNGWDMVSQEKDGVTTSSVIFEQIWHGACPHICMCFKKNSGTATTTPISDSTSIKEPSPNVKSGDVTETANDLSESVRKDITELAKSCLVSEDGGVQKENDGSNTSEMIICLKLSQLRSENVRTDVHILMYDSTTINVVDPEQETINYVADPEQETMCKTLD